MHKVGHIVALQLQHELHVVAYIVGTQAESLGQVTLVDTAGYTADEAHLGHVVEPHAIQRLGQGKGVGSLLHMQDALALEGMAGLEDTQRVGLALGERQLEGTVRAGLQGRAAAQQRVAVQREHGARYGNGGQLVQRTAGQARRGGVHKADTRGNGVVGRQRHAGALRARIIITELRVRVRGHDGVLGTSAYIVAEAVEQECSIRACRHGLDGGAVRSFQCYRHTCHAAVVRHEDVTAYLAVGRTPAFGRGAVVRSLTVAVVVRCDNVLVVLIRYSGLIEERVVLTGIDGICRSIAVLRDARQRIAIYRYGRGHPTQQYTTFLLPDGCTLAGSKRGDGCRLVEIEARAMDGYRL